MSTATTVKPPPCYPYDHWATDSRDPVYVHPEDREFFAHLEVTEEMHVAAIRTGVGVKPYTEWELAHRMRKTDEHRKNKLRAAQDEARKTPCPVCGQRFEGYQMVKVRTGTSTRNQVGQNVPDTDRACPDCAGSMERAYLALLPDGRVRDAVAIEVVARRRAARARGVA